MGGAAVAVVLAGCAEASGSVVQAPEVQSVRIPEAVATAAPAACPDDATWEPERGRCVRYLPVQRVPPPPLDLAHMPDPCGLAGAALSDCDPDSMNEPPPPSAPPAASSSASSVRSPPAAPTR